MPYADVSSFMAGLSEAPGVAAKALAFLILTAARSGEALGMTWDEIDFDAVTWTVPASRMKAKKAHRVPLNDPALAILRGQMAARGKNPHVFPSHLPRQALSNTSLALVMRRLGADAFTVHGMRASFRMWAADTGVAFEVAEACLAHAVGNAVVAAYQRSTMLERRRPVLQAWADFIEKPVTDVAPLRPAPASPKGFTHAVVLSRGDQKGALVSRHRSQEAAIRAAQPGGCNWSVREIGDDGLAKK